MKDDLNKAAAALGKKGGRAKSHKKAAAARENGRKGGRPRNCQCGQITGEACCLDPLPRSEMVELEFMPEEHRASHGAAGNVGCYPANGAIRILVSKECAAWLLDADDWTHQV